MLKTYLKISFRSLGKNKLYSLVNLFGLTVGITCCILITLYLYNELSYDRFHKNARQLVRVTSEYSANGNKSQNGVIGSAAGPELSAILPEVRSFVRILRFEPYVVNYGEKTFVESSFLFADSTFFKMFSFPLSEGDPSTALDGPGKIVITESMQQKYFGTQDALGKMLRIGADRNYIISGIAKDPPVNSQIKFDFVASFSSLSNANHPRWFDERYWTYFLLSGKYDISMLEKEISDYTSKHVNAHEAQADYITYRLQPITEVHLHSTLVSLEPNSSIVYVQILAAIALLILIVATANYANLTMAQSARRLPEIGIRKVMGSSKSQLFWQFIGESMILTFAAIALSFGIVRVILPLFDQLVERELDIRTLFNPICAATMIVLYLIVSLSAGIYPAMVLSGTKLIQVLKTGFSFSGKSGTLHRSLIIFQFSVSVFLIISTIVIFRQLSYIQNKALGYNRSNIAVVPVDNFMRDHYEQIKDAFKRVPGVVSISGGAELITDIKWEDAINPSLSSEKSGSLVKIAATDIDFVKTIGLHIIAGSDFTLSDFKQIDSALNKSPYNIYIVNESLVKAFGWNNEQAIGKPLYLYHVKGIIKAVVQNFHYTSIHESIGPFVILLSPHYRAIRQCYIKLSGSDIPLTLSKLQAAWKVRMPYRPFQFTFLDDNYNAVYHSEREAAKIFTTFASLAIVLGCLGLFALSAYSTVQRAKEIGIRKVLGAGTGQIILLMSGDYLKLVLAASVIAFPVAWIAAREWLQGFAYRVNLDWWIFILAAGLATTIAVCSIITQAVKAANANPVKSLRSE